MIHPLILLCSLECPEYVDHAQCWEGLQNGGVCGGLESVAAAVIATAGQTGDGSAVNLRMMGLLPCLIPFVGAAVVFISQPPSLLE